METVYKFSGKYGLAVLSELELKVTPPNQFNDPFEFTPKMKCADLVGFMRSERVCKGFYEIARLENGFRGTFQEYQANYPKVLEANMSNMLQGMTHAMQETFTSLEKEFLDEVSKHLGVLCLSGRRDSILMWGHYCDKPLGLVVGFDKASTIFANGKGLKPIQYAKQRIVFDASWEDESSEMARYSDQIIFSKSAEWSYEMEFRQIVALTSPQIEKKPLRDGTSGYFLQIPPETIVSVTLGPRVSAECESKVKDVLQKSHFSHVNLERAILNNSEYRLEFEPVK
jgi:hypothetical protein